jgi:ATP-dependent DNA helicase RecG
METKLYHGKAPQPPQLITPNTPLAQLGVNRVRVGILKKFGIESVHDLITYYPRRVIQPAIELKQLAQLERIDVATLKERKVMFNATVKSVRIFPAKGGWGVARLVVTLVADDNSVCEGLYFGKSVRYLKWLETKYIGGDQALVVGVGKRTGGKYQFTHPEINVYSPADSDLGRRSLLTKEDGVNLFAKPRPVYRATKRLSSARISETIRTLIRQLEDFGATNQVDPWSSSSSSGAQGKNSCGLQNLAVQLFPDVIEGSNRWQAIKNMHMPSTMQEYESALNQLRYEEAYILQSLLVGRSNNIRHMKSIALVPDNRGALAKFDAQLPWKLTKSQVEVGRTIADQLAQPIPMQRLLQGDVGSGKTVVALRAMLQAVDAGCQTVLLAPTEVLAAQHFASINQLLGDLAVTSLRTNDAQVQTELLTGSLTTKQKRKVEHSIASGTADIIIGTHALLYRKDLFKDLALVVVDEQHRFGVEQRNKLRDQSRLTPHLLVMTATPIPRSVAMLMFSDLQISTLKEMPSGRGTIETHIVEVSDKRLVARMWGRVREEIDRGRNAFVIVPRIHRNEMQNEGGNVEEITDELDGESKLVSPLISNNLFGKLVDAGLEEVLDDSTESIEQLKEELSDHRELQGVKLGVLHGELSSDEKDFAMREFVQRDAPLLISTTVVEVGIDVPNASVMVIMDANKFGMASLHQLRGRIGRGQHPSICFLVTSKAPMTEVGAQRIATISKYSDGFKISARDLELRREGNILGTEQSGGKSSLKLLRILEDQEIIQKAHEQAVATYESDPQLSNHIGLQLAIEREVTDQEKRLIAKS